jgi:hypothetical protein
LDRERRKTPIPTDFWERRGKMRRKKGKMTKMVLWVEKHEEKYIHEKKLDKNEI